MACHNLAVSSSHLGLRTAAVSYLQVGIRNSYWLLPFLRYILGASVPSSFFSSFHVRLLFLHVFYIYHIIIISHHHSRAVEAPFFHSHTSKPHNIWIIISSQIPSTCTQAEKNEHMYGALELLWANELTILWRGALAASDNCDFKKWGCTKSFTEIRFLLNDELVCITRASFMYGCMMYMVT